MHSIDRGHAGASALAEHARRSKRDRQRRRAQAPAIALRIGLVAIVATAVSAQLWHAPHLGLLFATAFAVKELATSQRTDAWRSGAKGEQRIGSVLESLDVPGTVLHDRRIPRSRANIDHLVVLGSGVLVIDAKRYRGRLELRRGQLRIGGRRRDDLLDKLARQVTVVREIVGDSVPVRGMLAFVDTELPKHRLSAGVSLLCTGRGMRRWIRRNHSGDVDIDTVVAVLDTHLSRAGASA